MAKLEYCNFEAYGTIFRLGAVTREMDLHKDEVRVLSVLAAHSGHKNLLDEGGKVVLDDRGKPKQVPDWECHLAAKTIAREAFVCERQAREMWKRLEARGIVLVTGDHTSGVHLFRVCPEVLYAGLQAVQKGVQAMQGGLQAVQEGLQGVQGGLAQPATKVLPESKPGSITGNENREVLPGNISPVPVSQEEKEPDEKPDFIPRVKPKSKKTTTTATATTTTPALTSGLTASGSNSQQGSQAKSLPEQPEQTTTPANQSERSNLSNPTKDINEGAAWRDGRGAAAIDDPEETLGYDPILNKEWADNPAHCSTRKAIRQRQPVAFDFDNEDNFEQPALTNIPAAEAPQESNLPDPPQDIHEGTPGANPSGRPAAHDTALQAIREIAAAASRIAAALASIKGMESAPGTWIKPLAPLAPYEAELIPALFWSATNPTWATRISKAIAPAIWLASGDVAQNLIAAHQAEQGAPVDDQEVGNYNTLVTLACATGTGRTFGDTSRYVPHLREWLEHDAGDHLFELVITKGNSEDHVRMVLSNQYRAYWLLVAFSSQNLDIEDIPTDITDEEIAAFGAWLMSEGQSARKLLFSDAENAVEWFETFRREMPSKEPEEEFDVPVVISNAMEAASGSHNQQGSQASNHTDDQQRHSMETSSFSEPEQEPEMVVLPTQIESEPEPAPGSEPTSKVETMPEPVPEPEPDDTTASPTIRSAWRIGEALAAIVGDQPLSKADLRKWGRILLPLTDVADQIVDALAWAASNDGWRDRMTQALDKPSFLRMESKCLMSEWLGAVVPVWLDETCRREHQIIHGLTLGEFKAQFPQVERILKSLAGGDFSGLSSVSIPAESGGGFKLFIEVSLRFRAAYYLREKTGKSINAKHLPNMRIGDFKSLLEAIGTTSVDFEGWDEANVIAWAEELMTAAKKPQNWLTLGSTNDEDIL
jgi:hypothetical protein